VKSPAGTLLPGGSEKTSSPIELIQPRTYYKLTRRLRVVQVIFQRSRILGESCALPEVDQSVRPRVAAPGGLWVEVFFWKLPVQAKCPSYSPEALFLRSKLCWVMLIRWASGSPKDAKSHCACRRAVSQSGAMRRLPFYMCWAARPGRLTSSRSRASRRSICRTLRPGSSGRCFACCWL
jgi:hypothetical protein